MLWLGSGNDRLRPDTLGLIENFWRNGDTILLSAVRVWEIAQLAYCGWIEMTCPLDDWVDRFIDRPGVEILPLDHRSAGRAYRLDGFEHGDPADRLLIAAAIGRGCPLVTYHAGIVRFAETFSPRYGFATLG